MDLSSCNWLTDIICDGNRIPFIDILPCYVLSAVTEDPPVIDNGIAKYDYDDHKVAFDAGTVLINIEPDFFLPDNLTTIEEEAFAGCPFQYVVLSDQTGFIGVRAFADCPDLRFIVIPNAEAAIDGQAFGDRTGLVIFGISGGTAETFAREHACTFIPLE